MRRFRGWMCRAALLLLAAWFAMSPARAQDDAALARRGIFMRDRNVSVAERPHPEFAAMPIPVGAFLLEPGWSQSLSFNDNIDATPDHPAADEIIRSAPNLQAQSDWARHQIAASADIVDRRYLRHPGESTTDWGIGTAGRYDAAADLGVAAGLAYRRETEPRTSSSAPQTARHPVRYEDVDAFLETTRAFDRLRVTGRASYQQLSFDDAEDFFGNPLIQHDRDRTIATAAMRAEYAFSPALSLFIRAAGNERRYHHQLIGEAARHSHGADGEIGANFDVTHLIRGELAAGYLDQDYANRIYGHVDGPSLRGRLEYFATPLMTATLLASRSVEDADIAGAGAYLSSNVVLQLDHEVLRPLILTARLAVGEDRYRGIDRLDDRLQGSFGGRYQLSRRMGVGLHYTYETRHSSGAQHGSAFVANSVTATVTFTL